MSKKKNNISAEIAVDPMFKKVFIFKNINVSFPKIGNVFFYKFSLFILVSIIFFTTSNINIFISGWNARPSAYFLFAGSIMFSCIYYLQATTTSLIGFNFIDAVVLAFFLICFLLTLILVFYSTFFIRDELVSYLSILILYLPFKDIQKRWPDIIWGIIILTVLFEIIVGCCQLAFVISEKNFELQHVAGTFRNTGIYTVFLSCCLPVLFYFSNKEDKSGLLKLLCKILITLTLFFALLLKSRTAILLFSCQLVFIGNKIIRQRSRPSFLKWNIGIIILGCLFIGLLFIKYNSMIGRVFIWNNALQLFLNKPVFGWGMGGFSQNYLWQQMNYFKQHPLLNDGYKFVAGNVTTAFNEYIELLVDFGVVGIIILGYLLFRISSICRKVDDSIDYAWQIFSLIGISALFYYSFHVTIFLLLTIISLGIISNHSPAIFHLRIPNTGIKLILKTAISGFGLSALMYCIVQYRAHRTWQYATIIDDKQVAIGLYEQAYPDLSHRAPFLYNYGAQLYEFGEYNKCISILEQSGKLTPNIDALLYLGKAYQQNAQFERAEQCFIDASNMVPEKFNPLYFLTLLYVQYGKYDQAIVIARRILDMPVKVPSAEIDTIMAYMKKLTIR